VSILHRLLLEAGRRAAQNPEVRRTAARVAGEVYGKVAPKVENAGRHMLETAKETASEGRFSDDPVGYARRFRDRLLPPDDDRR